MCLKKSVYSKEEPGMGGVGKQNLQDFGIQLTLGLWNLFSCDSSSIGSNVGRSVGRSVCRSVGLSVPNNELR